MVLQEKDGLSGVKFFVPKVCFAVFWFYSLMYKVADCRRMAAAVLTFSVVQLYGLVGDLG